jgi:hypothetical protein
MDLHVYRNSQDRWHDLKDTARRQGAVLAINAVTLTDLVERIVPEVKSAGIGQRLALVSDSAVVDSRYSAGGRYAYDAISQLKASRVRPQELRAAGETFLADTLDAYDRSTRRAGLCDPQDRFVLAASRVTEGGVRWLDRFERVVLHTLYDLTEAEFSFVRSLIETLPEGGAVVLFNTTANVKPTQFAEWTWQRFIHDESLAERTFPEFCKPSTRTRAVLEKLFLFEAHEPLPPDDSLKILELPGRYKEVEKIAGEIADLLASGESPNEVVVVVRHLDIYGEMLEDVLSRYEILHRFETGTPLLRMPFIKYWLALLDLVTSERSRQALARVMGSAYFNPRLSSSVHVERALADFGYIDRRHLSASALAARKNSPLTTEIRRFERTLDELEGAVETIPDFMSRLPAASNLTDRDRQAWRVLAEEMTSIAEIHAARALSFSDFRRMASDIASLRTVDYQPSSKTAPGVPRVRIVHPSSLGFRAPRWIFSPGFSDGEIPARSSPNPFLTDAVVNAINARIRPRRLMSARDRSRKEPLYLFMTLDSATERVTLTYPSNNLEGDRTYPSVYIGEIERHYAESPIVRPGRGPARSEGEWLSKVAEEWQRGRLHEDRARELLGSETFQRAKLESRGIMRARFERGLLPLDGVWHPSELNSLSQCPFVFLARHRLKIRSSETPDFEVPTLEIGVLAHVILRDFHSQPVPSSVTEARTRMNEIIARRLSAADVNGAGPYSVFDPSLWRIRRRQLVSALDRYVDFAVRDALDGFETQPEYLDAPLPASPMGRVMLAGKPDHVAVHRNGSVIDAIRVDDFKYSSASSGLARQLKTSFQIPVYAYLATRALGLHHGVRIDGRYLLLRSPGNPVVTQPIDEALFEDVKQRIDVLLEKVNAGTLEPDPSDRQSCVECDYRRLCRLYGS